MEQSLRQTEVINPSDVEPFKGTSKRLQILCAKLSNQMTGDGFTYLEDPSNPIPTQSQIYSAAFDADKQRKFLKDARKVIRESNMSERYSIFDKQIELIAKSKRGKPSREELKRREEVVSGRPSKFSISPQESINIPGGPINPEFSISPQESTNPTGPGGPIATREFNRMVETAFSTSVRVSENLLTRELPPQSRTGVAGTREQKQKLVSNMSMGSSQLRSTLGMQTWTQLPDEQSTGRSTQSSEPTMRGGVNQLRGWSVDKSTQVDFGIPLEELVPVSPHDLSTQSRGTTPGSPGLLNAILDVLDESGVNIDEDEVRNLTESMSRYITGEPLTSDQKDDLLNDIFRATPNMKLSDSVTADLLKLTDNFSSNPSLAIDQGDEGDVMVEYDENPMLELIKPNTDESKYDQTERKYNVEPPVQQPIESKALEEVEQSFEPTKDIAEVAGAFENAFSLIYGSEYDSAVYGTENIERVKNFVEQSKLMREIGEKHGIKEYIEYGKSGLIESGEEVLKSAKKTGIESLKDIATDVMTGGELDPWAAATSVAENVLAEGARRVRERVAGEVPRDAPGQLDELGGILRGGRGFSEGAGGSGDLPVRYNRQGHGGIHASGNHITLAQRFPNINERPNADPRGKPVPIDTTLAGAAKGKTVIKKKKPRRISTRQWGNQVDLVQQGVAGANAYRNIFQNTYG